MKQRVALARALAPDPKVLLVDEPFGALDALTRAKLYGDLQEIHQRTRKTIILVTHDPREAACLGDRVLVFSGRPGRVKADITIEPSTTARHQRSGGGGMCRGHHGSIGGVTE